MDDVAIIDEGAIPVVFNGERYVWLKKSDGTGPLAYPDHVDEDGYVTIDHMMSDSFGHVMSDGKIWRYREIIGSVDDLQFVTN